ncbi:hypothetical protein J3998_12405 [Thiomicrorhabdus sp. 6S2-11]|jgi:flagellar biosynthesis/type III secretory pathway protein FliH|uniref:Flagellar assembly protein FliH n=1 Tax=Thiomicrorhabdus marina TaxID=2818442 RepID=A0ABS3Q986_9GAMM|nr:FliH/SctL family protein [Thiomicrorhabdus marina]MBO1928375.1 hypothetical protein [Thiomicrorhabdus marina]
MSGSLDKAGAHEVQDNENLKVRGQLIDGETLTQKVSAEAIVPWTLSDFEQEAQRKEDFKQEVIRQEVEKQIQPELQKRSDMFKKEVYDSAYQEGYDAGFKLGQQEGEATGKSQAYSQTRDFLFPKIQAMNELLKSLQAPQQQMEQSLFDEIVQFSSFIAEQLIGERLAQNAEWLEQAVKESIQTLPESDAPIEVVFNPEDLAFLKELETDWLKDYQLKADGAILPGGCLVKQQFSSVHNCWQNRFLDLKEQITNNVEALTEAKEKAQQIQQEGMDDIPWDEQGEFSESEFAPVKPIAADIPDVSASDFPAKKNVTAKDSPAEPKNVKQSDPVNE